MARVIGGAECYEMLAQGLTLSTKARILCVPRAVVEENNFSTVNKLNWACQRLPL
jgi:hypothetical protein